MKQLYIIFLILSLTSCKEKIDTKYLIGSWKLKDVVDKTNMNAQEKTTYYKSDSLSIEMFTNGKLFSKSIGTYKLDSATATYTATVTIDRNTFSINYKILKLTNEELNVEELSTKRSYRFIRF
ncbi:hypothetical protein BH10BAC1_BH10BAC1_11290 [soil metagenome]